MKATDQAFPVVTGMGVLDGGMDIRTYLAGQAMQGLMLHPNLVTYEEVAMAAVGMADALIEELNKVK